MAAAGSKAGNGGGFGASAAGVGGEAFVAALLPSDLLRCGVCGGGLRHAYLLTDLGSATLAPNDDTAGGKGGASAAGEGFEGGEPISSSSSNNNSSALVGAADENNDEEVFCAAVTVRWLHATRDANAMGDGPGGSAWQLDGPGSELVGLVAWRPWWGSRSAGRAPPWAPRR